MKTIRIEHGNHKHGKSWAKKVSKVDFSQRGGYSFEGQFIPVGESINMEEGSVILHVEHRGSRKNGVEYADMYKVTSEGLERVKGFFEFRKDFADVQNEINKLLS